MDGSSRYCCLLKGPIMTKTKLAYAAPQMRQHGAMEALTQGQSDGSRLDATFTAGTPGPIVLTFS